jgi:hypothetical protein
MAGTGASSLGEWCNGSTTDSGSVSLGSNPSSPAPTQSLANQAVSNKDTPLHNRPKTPSLNLAQARARRRAQTPGRADLSAE